MVDIVRICAAADLHHSDNNWARSIQIAETMCASQADVIVLAGDVATGAEKHYRKVLRLFRGFRGPKLFVPGNHDLWTRGYPPDTMRRYQRTLRRIVEGSDFHYLPDNPLVLRGVGFVGTVGWYDYTFRQSEPPQPGTRVTPLRARRTRKGLELRAVPGRHDVAWEKLEAADYAGHALVWNQDNVWKQLVWNDALYIRWGLSDPEVAKMLAEKLARDIQAIEASADRWVAVIHMVPFSELAGTAARDVETAYVRAFAGSPLFGKLFSSHAKCRLVVCGHRHKSYVLSVGEIVAANCSVGDGHNGPLLISLDETQGFSRVPTTEHV